MRYSILILRTLCALGSITASSVGALVELYLNQINNITARTIDIILPQRDQPMAVLKTIEAGQTITEKVLIPCFAANKDKSLYTSLVLLKDHSSIHPGLLAWLKINIISYPTLVKVHAQLDDLSILPQLGINPLGVRDPIAVWDNQVNKLNDHSAFIELNLLLQDAARPLGASTVQGHIKTGPSQ